MKLQFIRQSTLILNYAGKKFLVDPFLAEKHRYPAIPGAHSNEANPTVNLPLSVEQIIKDIDAVVVTHTHIDHWDEVAINAIAKNTPILALSDSIAEEIKGQGFTDITVVTNNSFADIELIRTGGKHGHGELAKMLGEVWGLVFTHPKEKSIYITGDTVLTSEVEEVLLNTKPDVVVVAGGANQLLEGGPVVMDKDDIFKTNQILPTATIVSTHMEATNHAFLSRKELTDAIKEKNLTETILVPEDGDILEF